MVSCYPHLLIVSLRLVVKVRWYMRVRYPIPASASEKTLEPTWTKTIKNFATYVSAVQFNRTSWYNTTTKSCWAHFQNSQDLSYWQDRFKGSSTEGWRLSSLVHLRSHVKNSKRGHDTNPISGHWVTAQDPMRSQSENSRTSHWCFFLMRGWSPCLRMARD
jgi:hypothetical protein